MFDVVALGELLIDFAPHSVNETGYPVLAAQPGGAPANFLAALNRYGYRTAMIGKVGDDMFGRLLLGTLQSAGIDTQGILKDPEVFTTLAFVSLDENGNRDSFKASVVSHNNTISFAASHFSVYVVVETVVPRLTVKFMNGSSEVASMIIKAADTAAETGPGARQFGPGRSGTARCR